uniref:Uncharacterized protein n=1 Tax=Pyricularia oryzae (strain P131) TaxID=1143193 RepID=L7IQR2_PYRO1
MHKSAKSAVAGLKDSRTCQNDVESQRQEDRIKQLVRLKAPTTAAVADNLLIKTCRRNTEPFIPRVMSLKILIRHADKMVLLEKGKIENFHPHSTAAAMPSQAFAAAAASRRPHRGPAQAQPSDLAGSQHVPDSQQPKRPYHGAAEPAKDAAARHPPSDGAAWLDMTQLIQKLQRDVDVQKEVYQNVEAHFARILRDHEGDKYEDHRKLAMSIEDVVLGHLRLQMLGEKERPRSPSRSPPKTDQGSPADNRAGKATVPGAANRSWATVAASAAISARSAITTPSKGGSTPPPPVRKQPDRQVLIRVHQPGLDPREPFALRRKTSEAVGVTLAEIPAIMRTPTGWAIRAANATIKDKLLEAGAQE